MQDKEKRFSEINKKILSLGLTIVKRVTNAINMEVKAYGSLEHYKVVWEQLERIANPEIKNILEENFSGCKITIAKSKSTYPDVKMEFDGFIIAIDVKSNESSKDPWYDIARLDTIEESRLKKFDEEYDLVVKYDSETRQLLDMYFETLRDTVGFNNKCNGVKFRPYDGKLRPKIWKDFSEKKTYWPTKEAFIEGIKKSKKFRFHALAKYHYENLTKEEKEEFKKLFE